MVVQLGTLVVVVVVMEETKGEGTKGEGTLSQELACV